MGLEEIDMGMPLVQFMKRKKRKGPAQPNNSELAQLPAAAETPSVDDPPEIEVSEFDSSVENHFKAVDSIAELCGHPEILDSDADEIQRFSSSLTFLREWRDFKYKPQVVKFVCQHNLKELDVIGNITLPQFSSAAFPKRGMHTESNITGTESNKDFVMNVGGSVWALDWCPQDNRISDNHIKSEFVAVAAHPPESSYHKMGAPLTGRGAIQVWCLLTAHVKEGNKRPRGNSKKNKSAEPKRPRGRPRKKPLHDSVEEMETDTLYVQPISVDNSQCSPRLYGSDCTFENFGHVSEDCETTYRDAKTSGDFIPKDVALPRMMLCLAHNGKVAWDIKWRPISAYNSGSLSRMGYLAVLLGNGALEVWEVPLPRTLKIIYPVCQGTIDPRFIKLQPVFRCSMLKCRSWQSIPLTMEWSVSPPHDMILVGCHDGTIALWKFSITGSSTETRPLLTFNADTGPIRMLAWTPPQSDLGSEHVIVTAGHKGFKFWDIRDPFRPLWQHYIQGVSCSVDWLPDPRCVLGSTDDGTLWLISLVKVLSNDIPVAGKSANAKQGILHSFYCSLFAIWCIQASRLTGMVAYCGQDGRTFCFQPTTRLVVDPRKANKVHHHLCGSVLEEDSAIVVASPSKDSPLSKIIPSMTRGPNAFSECKDKIPKEHASKGQKDNNQPILLCDGDDPIDEFGSQSSDVTKELLPNSSGSSKSKSKGEGEQKSKGERVHEVFPPKIVAMHRVRWNVNKGSERWLCYGGAAGLVRCQEVDLSASE